MRHTHKQCDRVEKRLKGDQVGCLDDFSALAVCLAVSAALGHVLLPLQTQKPLAPLLCQPLHMLQAALPMQRTQPSGSPSVVASSFLHIAFLHSKHALEEPLKDRHIVPRSALPIRLSMKLRSLRSLPLRRFFPGRLLSPTCKQTLVGHPAGCTATWRWMSRDPDPQDIPHSLPQADLWEVFL